MCSRAPTHLPVHAGRRGSAMVMVLIALTIAFIMGMSYFASSRTATDLAEALDDHAMARQIAESGIELVTGYIENEPNWRADRSSGDWLVDFELLGGTVSVDGTFAIDPAAGALTVTDPSFEATVATLPTTPILSPPMNGVIGGWDVSRTAAVVLGPLVPALGTQVSASATDGTNVGFVTFTLSVNGSGTFSQTLGDVLAADTAYRLSVDIGTAGLAGLLSDCTVSVYAGATLVAASSDPTLLNLLDIDGDFATWMLDFETDGAPPAGAIRIEILVESLVGVASGAAFDNVMLEIVDSNPVVLTATSEFGVASHRVQATATEDATGLRITSWDES